MPVLLLLCCRMEGPKNSSLNSREETKVISTIEDSGKLVTVYIAYILCALNYDRLNTTLVTLVNALHTQCMFAYMYVIAYVPQEAIFYTPKSVTKKVEDENDVEIFDEEEEDRHDYCYYYNNLYYSDDDEVSCQLILHLSNILLISDSIYIVSDIIWLCIYMYVCISYMEFWFGCVKGGSPR